MKHVLLKFFSTVLFTSLVFIFAPYLALQRDWIESVPSFSIVIVSALAMVTLALFYYLQNVQRSNPQKFIQSYMLSITLKMVIGCTLILILIFMDREGAIANALLFIVSYFLFTALEIFFLLRNKTIS